MNQIKSRERVRELAEVYTADREIDAMLDLVGDESYKIDFRWLEPACGNGNFLVRILERKMRTVCAQYRRQAEFEFNTLKALTGIYGVDICSANVKESRMRLEAIIVDRYSDHLNTRKPKDGFMAAVSHVLKINVQHGDMLNGVHKVRFTEFSSPRAGYFRQRIFRLVDMLADEDLFAKSALQPVREIPAKHYLRLVEHA